MQEWIYVIGLFLALPLVGWLWRNRPTGSLKPGFFYCGGIEGDDPETPSTLDFRNAGAGQILQVDRRHGRLRLVDTAHPERGVLEITPEVVEDVTVTDRMGPGEPEEVHGHQSIAFIPVCGWREIVPWRGELQVLIHRDGAGAEPIVCRLIQSTETVEEEEYRRRLALAGWIQKVLTASDEASPTVRRQ